MTQAREPSPATVSGDEQSTGAGDPGDAAALFAVLWAVATLFHLFGASMRAVAFPVPTVLGVTSLALGLVAVAVLVRPRDPRPLVVLALLQPVTAWLEAPVLGNHWVIAGFVGLTILVAAAHLVRRDGQLDAQRLHAGFAPAARWVLLLSYAFAAFAKLNEGFLDPAVSCAVFFFRESAGAVGLGPLVANGPGWVAIAVIAATVTVELSVPVLLLVRRTRTWGVLVGVAFHTVVALDLAHPFFDFSSVLFALFVLFLPPAFATRLRVRFAGLARRPRRLLRDVGLVLVTVLVAAAAGPATPGLAAPVILASYLGWFAYAGIMLAAVASFVVGGRGPVAPARHGGRSPMRLSVRATAVVLALVVVNGLTPYLELKTAFGFNMYSNLVTVAGRSNHLLVARTVPVAGGHGDLVTITASDDPDLAFYAEQGYALTWPTLQAYLAEHPAADVTYLRDGVVQRHDAGTPVAAVPIWQEKLRVFRAVDLRDPPRCQDRFAPAH